MSTTTTAQRFAAMDSWLSLMDREVSLLRVNEFVFWELQRMIRQNRKLRVPSEFYEWLGRMYVGGMSVGIRRQVDPDTRTQSFVRFLNQLKGDPSIISRSHYRRLYPLAQRPSADRIYDSLVGKGRNQLMHIKLSDRFRRFIVEAPPSSNLRIKQQPISARHHLP